VVRFVAQGPGELETVGPSLFGQAVEHRSARVGKPEELGGLVEVGSVRKFPDGRVEFSVTDNKASAKISYQGDLPDLFREGQGIVAEGAFDASGEFVASRVLAKHDEQYMPREVADAIKEQGEWRGDGAKGDYDR
jgi:cytochrome c-type biogenesis protein CcmE